MLVGEGEQLSPNYVQKRFPHTKSVNDLQSAFQLPFSYDWQLNFFSVNCILLHFLSCFFPWLLAVYLFAGRNCWVAAAQKRRIHKWPNNNGAKKGRKSQPLTDVLGQCAQNCSHSTFPSLFWAFSVCIIVMGKQEEEGARNLQFPCGRFLFEGTSPQVTR